MDAGTGFSAQVWELSNQFLPKDWILEQWDDGYYITALAGSTTGSALVIMSKGTPYTQQSYKVSDSFPFKWINKKWKEGFYVTSMATSGTRWAVVMSRNAGFVDQCVELDSCTLRRGFIGGGTAVFASRAARRRPIRRLSSSAFRAGGRRTRHGRRCAPAPSPAPTLRRSGRRICTSAPWLLVELSRSRVRHGVKERDDEREHEAE